MSDETVSGVSWYSAVLADLGAACRRDGLTQSAEMLDDLAVVVEQEQSRLHLDRKEMLSKGKLALKVVSN